MTGAKYVLAHSAAMYTRKNEILDGKLYQDTVAQDTYDQIAFRTQKTDQCNSVAIVM